jgi:membrane protein YqaA with SNARE-associated domain
LQTIKHILSHYTKWIWSWLGPLGPWGVFVITAIDGSFVGLPVDAVIAGYVYSDRAHLFFYVILASAGSAVGSSVLYVIGYLGGEALLKKRMPPARYEKIHASFERHEFWALMFPAMLPPPTPFKLFVLAAAVAEMRYLDFLAAIFAGRFIRFLILGLLTIKFGPQIVHLTGDLFRQHLWWVLVAVAGGLTVWFLVRRRKASADCGVR